MKQNNLTLMSLEKCISNNTSIQKHLHFVHRELNKMNEMETKHEEEHECYTD